MNNFFQSIDRNDPREYSGIIYMEDSKKVELVNNIIEYITNDYDIEMYGFSGRISGCDMILSFDISQLLLSKEMLKLIRQTAGIKFIAHEDWYITVEMIIKDYTYIDET